MSGAGGGPSFRTTRLRGDSIELAGRMYGPPAPRGPDLLLVPGLFDTFEAAHELASSLAAKRRVHVLELRGHGDSDRPARGYRAEEHARDIGAVLAGLDAPVDVYGYSFGASIAVLAAASTDRVRRLVLEEPPSLDGAAAAPLLRAWLELRALPFDEVVRALARQTPRRGRELVEANARGLRSTFDPAFLELIDAPDPDWQGALARVQAPALLLVADAGCGGVLDPAQVQALRRAHPALEVASFAGAGHCIHAEQPGPLLDRVLDFLAR